MNKKQKGGNKRSEIKPKKGPKAAAAFESAKESIADAML